MLVTSSLILSTLVMEVIRYSETSVLRRVTCYYIPEDGIQDTAQILSSAI
jgi:hypothetical protein